MKYIIKFIDGSYNIGFGFESSKKEAAQYNSFEEAESVAKQLDGVKLIEEINDSDKWKIEYNNDEGPNGEGFWEWWTVSNGEKEFKSSDEEDAKWLCNFLNKNE